MADPLTLNTGLAIPTRGSDVGVWDTPVNSDFVALDGFFGGVQTLGLSSSPVTLSVPAGFTATPSGGPTQAQNAVLRLTGTLTANVTVTLPMPGYYIVENLTTGLFLVTLRAVTATQVICIDKGMVQHIYNDGANVRFVNFGETGKMELWGGRSTIPSWVTGCTVPPYLLCDGSVYNFSVYPYLGILLGNQFGGNGITTFGVPDLRGRVPLAYDGTGTRITTAGSGINGQIVGASADNQSVTLTANQIPSITSQNSSQAMGLGVSVPSIPQGNTVGIAQNGSSPATVNSPVSSGGLGWGTFTNWNQAIAVSSINTGGALHTNVQPSIVAGVWVIRAA
jgi:microcystin-dependent protein